MERRRRHVDDEPTSPKAQAPQVAATAALLDLQRTVGNSAVARMLQRQPDVMQAAEGAGRDMASASGALEKWLVGMSNATRRERGGGDGSLSQSMAELVQMARAVTFKTHAGPLDLSGKDVPVGDVLSNSSIEEQLRRDARHHGIPLTEHRSLADPAGAKAEAKAVIANAGAELPSSFELEVDAKAATVKVSAGGDIEAKIKGGGVEAGGKAELDSEKGVKAAKGTLKLGSFIEISGGVKKTESGRWTWYGELQIGTLGGIVTPADIAKVMLGLQKTLTGGGKALAESGPGELGLHAVEVQNAVSEVVEKVKKSAEQNKSGMQFGFGVQSDEHGGVSGAFTFTWRF